MRAMRNNLYGTEVLHIVKMIWDRSQVHVSCVQAQLAIEAVVLQAIAFETEAYALLDTMKYIAPDVFTLVIGEARGNAAMLVASGKKGNRFILPLSRMMTAPPRMNRSFGTTVDMMIRAQELEFHTEVRHLPVPSMEISWCDQSHSPIADGPCCQHSFSSICC